MPHKVFAIENIYGEVGAQPSRITKRPSTVRGRLEPHGGVSILPAPSVAVDNAELIGYDWLGNVIRNRGNYVYADYAQSEALLAHFDGTISGYNDLFFQFWPGGALAYGNSAILPRALLYLGERGYWCSSWNVGSDIDYDIVITEQDGGSWEQDNCITFFLVVFARGLYGWVPVGHKAVSHRVSANNRQIFYEITLRNIACSCPLRAKLYVQWAEQSLSTYCINKNGSLFDEVFDHTFRGLARRELVRADIGEGSYRPTFYFGANESNTLNRAWSVKTTYSRARTFFLNTIRGGSASAVSVDYDCVDACNSGGVSFYYHSCSDGRIVWYSDEGFIGFSANPNFIRIEDVALAVVPSTRGIYIASGQQVYEAYGDFETEATRVERMPIGYGVDDAPFVATTSGRNAFFVKSGTVYQVGVGGLKEVYRPERDMLPVLGASYDRLHDFLLVHNNERVMMYDSDANGWVEMPLTSGFYVVAGQNKYVTNDYSVSFSGTSGTIQIDFEKLDFGAPGLRKRVHVIRIPYLGNYTDFAVRIARPGDPFQLCALVDRGGYIEARCPSIVSDAFNVRITADGDERDLVINPPILFAYSLREREYARD